MTHIPVLLKEVIEILNLEPRKFIVDGTIGDGGHAAEILKKISPGGTLLGIDWDKNTIEKLENDPKLHPNETKIIFINENYVNLPEILKNQNLGKADGLILDLGFSSTLLEESGRGLSFQKDEPLDMRYYIPDKFQISKLKIQKLTASEIINKFSEKELADIIYKYSGERFSRRIAKKIIKARRNKKIKTTLELAEIIKSAVPKNYKKNRLNPATRTFQALRIYINNELNNLSKVLNNLTFILKPQGRIVIISFHSLEDRIVKQQFKLLEKEGELKILTKKPIEPGEEEIKINARARSAKLRAAEIL